MDLQQQKQLRFIAIVVGYLLLTAATLWILWHIRVLGPPFFVALVLAITLAPLVDRLETKGWPRWLATLGLYTALFLALGTLFFVLRPLVSDQIGQIVLNLRAKFHLDQPSVDLSRKMVETIRVFGRKNEIPSFIIAPMIHQAKNSANLLTTGLERFGNLLLGLIPGLIWVVLVPILAFYGLIDYHRIFAKALLLVPRNSREDIRGIASDVTVVFGKYLRGLGLVCLLDMVATIIVLLCFKPTRPYAAALGLIAGIFYAVPYLGAILSITLIAFVAYASQGGSLSTMLVVTATMLLLHQIVFDQVLTPRILGAQVGLHPILSILALMAGDLLFGIGGMLLAVPVAASLQIIALHIVPRLSRNIDVHIQTDPPATPAATDTEDRQKTVAVQAGEGVVGHLDTHRDPPEKSSPAASS